MESAALAHSVSVPHSLIDAEGSPPSGRNNRRAGFLGRDGVSPSRPLQARHQRVGSGNSEFVSSAANSSGIIVAEPGELLLDMDSDDESSTTLSLARRSGALSERSVSMRSIRQTIPPPEALARVSPPCDKDLQVKIEQQVREYQSEVRVEEKASLDAIERVRALRISLSVGRSVPGTEPVANVDVEQEEYASQKRGSIDELALKDTIAKIKAFREKEKEPENNVPESKAPPAIAAASMLVESESERDVKEYDRVRRISGTDSTNEAIAKVKALRMLATAPKTPLAVLSSLSDLPQHQHQQHHLHAQPKTLDKSGPEDLARAVSTLRVVEQSIFGLVRRLDPEELSSNPPESFVPSESFNLNEARKSLELELARINEMIQKLEVPPEPVGAAAPAEAVALPVPLIRQRFSRHLYDGGKIVFNWGGEFSWRHLVLFSETNAVRAIVDAVDKAGFRSAVFKRVCADYYDRSLEERKQLLDATSTAQLCKTVVMENIRCTRDDCSDPNNSRFYAVLVVRVFSLFSLLRRHVSDSLRLTQQYEEKLSNEKMIKLIQGLSGGVLSKSKFNFRLCPEETCARLTGFTHNAVVPIGMKTRKFGFVFPFFFRVA